MVRRHVERGTTHGEHPVVNYTRPSQRPVKGREERAVFGVRRVDLKHLSSTPQAELSRPHVSDFHRSAQRSRPRQLRMFGQQAVKLARHLGGKGGRAADAEVDMRPDRLQSRRKLARIVVGHEVQKVEPPIGPSHGPRTNRHLLPHPHLVDVPHVPLERKRAGVVGLEVLLRQPDLLKDIVERTRKEVRVPHHVHVTVNITVFFGYPDLEAEREHFDVRRCDAFPVLHMLPLDLTNWKA